MSPEEEAEAQVKSLLWAKMRREHGDEWMTTHASFLEAEWEWAKQLGMLDPEVDIPAFSQPPSPQPPPAATDERPLWTLIVMGVGNRVSKKWN